MSSSTYVWLFIGLLGLILYMLPAVMKTLWVENFQDIQDNQTDTGSVNTILKVEEAKAKETPSYLQNIPNDFSQAVMDVFKTEPATIESLAVSQGMTPAEQQGRLARKTVGSPSSVPASTEEGFYAGPSPAVSEVMSEDETKCTMEYNPDGSGDHTVVCKTTGPDGKTKTYNGLPEDMDLPDWLKGMGTRDMSSEDMEFVKLWMEQQNIQMNELDFANFVKQEAKKETKKEEAKKEETKKAEEAKKAETSTSACAPKKPACPPKKPVTCPVHAEPTKGCPKCPDMRDYVRKDSIPCWACKL